MVVSEFYSSAVIVQRFIQDKQVMSRLNAIATVFHGSNKEGPALAKKRIKALTKELIAFEAETGFPVQGSIFLRYFELHEIFNIATWAEREKHLATPQAADIQQEIMADVKRVQTANQLLVAAIKGLAVTATGNTAPATNFFTLPKDQVLVTLNFDGQDDAEFSKVSDKIKQLEKNLCLLSRLYTVQEAKHFKIVSMSKASPLAIDIAVFSGVAFTINKIISGVLDNITKVQGIRKQEQEIKSLKLSNEREQIILAQLKEELKDHAGTPSQLRDEIMSTVKEQDIDGSRAELDKAVLEACKYFVQLLQNQARVQVHLNAHNAPQQGGIDPATALLNDRISKRENLSLLDQMDKSLEVSTET